MFTTAKLVCSILLLMTSAVHAESFTVSNTFQDPRMTGGKELPAVELNPFAFANQSAEIGEGVELENFIGFYSIDFSPDLSSLKMIVADTARPASNPLPSEQYDRYYYSFQNVTLLSATIDEGSSTESLGAGASVDVSDGRLMVEFGEGADITPGNVLVVNIR